MWHAGHGYPIEQEGVLRSAEMQTEQSKPSHTLPWAMQSAIYRRPMGLPASWRGHGPVLT